MDEAIFASYLRPNEELLWTGRPDPDALFNASDKFMVPFSIVWSLGAVVAAFDSSPKALPLVMKGLILFLAFHLLVGRLIWRSYLLRRMIYAVTTQRVMFLRQGRSDKLFTFDIASLRDVRLEPSFDVRATIAFGSLFKKASNPPWHDGEQPRFIRIIDAERVYAMINERLGSA